MSEPVLQPGMNAVRLVCWSPGLEDDARDLCHRFGICDTDEIHRHFIEFMRRSYDDRLDGWHTDCDICATPPTNCVDNYNPGGDVCAYHTAHSDTAHLCANRRG